MKGAQENLRLSANQQQKMARELEDYRRKIEENNRENERNKQKMTKLTSENKNLNSEITQAQDSLRLSSNQQQKMAKEMK